MWFIDNLIIVTKNGETPKKANRPLFLPFLLWISGWYKHSFEILSSSSLKNVSVPSFALPLSNAEYRQSSFR